MEKYFKHLKVSKKLERAFTGVFVLFIIAIITSIAIISSSSAGMREFHDISYYNDTLQMEIGKELQSISKLVLWSLTTTDEAERQQYLEMAGACEQRLSTNVALLKESFSDPALVEELEMRGRATGEILVGLVEYAATGNVETALAIYNDEFVTEMEDIQIVLDQIGEISGADADTQYTYTIMSGNVGIIMMLIVAVIFFLFVRLTHKVLTRLINQPISEIESATELLKAGQFHIQIEYESQDELGTLAVNFKEACDTLNEIVKEIDYLLGEIADGNFDVNTSKKEIFVGQFEQVLESIEKMNMRLDDTMKQIRGASDQVASGSAQLAGSAEELAEGATEQAGAIEELTATVEEVASISKESAENADQACEMVIAAGKNAEKSQEELQNLTDAMTRISDTSKEIQDIIVAIEDIADQTNLLSLNASIEAARAGEAGRGFAVVADQIGKLAADSAQSAANTKALIEKSLLEIENGNMVTEKTVAAFHEILSGLKAFEEAANGASESSNIQADMLKQIEQGIEQISGVVQNNSAAAQETSATSQELSAQSENLKALVGKFTLRKE